MKFSNEKEQVKGHWAKGRKRVIVFIAFLLVAMMGFASAAENTSHAASRENKNSISQVNVAQNALAAAGTLKPVEGKDTNIQVMAQNIVNKAAKGVTVKVVKSNNPQIEDAKIIYGSSASEGTVTFALTQKKSMTVTQVNQVFVPAATAQNPVEEPVITNPPPVVVEPPKTTEPPVVVEEPEVANPPIQEEIALNAYYVSTTGKDTNVGNAQAPFRTIQKAANVAKAGDTVYIKGGTYNERVLVKNSGNSSSYITFSGFLEEKVIIDGTGITTPYHYYPSFDVNGQSYLKIENIGIRNADGQGIGDVNDKVNNTNIIIKNCSTYNTNISGIHFNNASNITIDGAYIDTANLTADQEALTLAGVSGFEIKNSTIVNAKKECIDVKDGSRNGKIYNNTVKNARLGSGLAIYVDGSKKGCSDIEIYNNTIDNCIQGIVVASELGGAVSNINIHGNNISNCQYGLQIAGWGFITGGTHPMNTISMSRNTLSGNMSIDLILSNPDAKNVTITNNVFGGITSTVPISVKGGNLAETTIDGNALNRIIDGYPTGTNYTLIK